MFFSFKFRVFLWLSHVPVTQDFVGATSRLSRRVGSQLLMQRTLQRYKVLAYLKIFEKA